MKKNILILLLIFKTAFSFAQNDGVFPAPANPIVIYGKSTSSAILIDGKLNEDDWTNATPISNFLQIEPFQGLKPKYSTIVKVLYDKNYLYISAVCKDSLGKKGIRVQDFRRDFEYFENDLFGIALDPFNGKRNATAFQTNPYGALRDLQVFDDNIFDRDWDALWKSRSTITDDGWICEMAIPWKTLRYPRYKNNDITWGINFVRVARRDNETSAFPNYPRSFDAYRMNYAAELKGIEPPKPSTNIQVNPYFITQFGSQKEEGSPTEKNNSTKIGGEIKYSPTAHSTIDLTFNTDFAQADADRQVNNLTRFSIFFPERRQFFLENAGLFDAGNQFIYTPFFSRTIGLDNSGNPIPIDGGIRFTDKNNKYSIGALYVHQQEKDATPAANNSVVRFIKNYGNQNNIGILITNKINESYATLKTNTNSTATITGFNRFNDKLNLEFSISGSKNNGNIKDDGFAATTSLNYSTNDLSCLWNTGIISKDFNPALGFVARNDFYKNFVSFYLIKRKQKWFPKSVRSFEPGFKADFYQNIDNLKLQEGYLGIYPFFFVFNNGSSTSITYNLNWQILTQNFDPVGIEIQAGNYNYQSINLNYSSDQSKKFSFSTDFTTGGFYTGKLTTYSANIRYAPSSHFAANINYEENQLREIGITKENLTTKLVTPNIRMALNPRVQMNVFYQYNTVDERSRWNARFSWEYQPLSYIYLVFNESKTTNFRQYQSIAKISFLKQF